MAKHKGRGIATIEYPTGMNQNGDPSQAWVKLKPDGRVDVFTGTVDHGQGSRTVHTQIAADTLGVPYDWITMDNTNTDSSAVCTGSFASRGTFIGGNAVRFAAEKAREKILEIASKEMEIDPSDLELANVADVEVDDETGEVVVERLVQIYDVGRAINPTLVEGQIEGGAMMGLGLGLLEAAYPYYPSVEHRGDQFGAYLAPAMEDLPELDNVILENPSADGPFGAKAIGEMANNAQPAAICSAIHDAVGVWINECPATPERVLRALEEKREPRREGKRVIFDEPDSVRGVSSVGGRQDGSGFLLASG